jgi:hypothetical protein
MLLAEAPKVDRKPWLKGSEVRKLLGISPGNCRIYGLLDS